MIQVVDILFRITAARKRAQAMLGMVGGDSKKMMERRVRGLCLPKKSRSGLRLAALLLSCVLTVCCFTTACHPVKKETDVPTDAPSSASEAQTPAAKPTAAPAPVPLKQIDAPKRYTAQIDPDTIGIPVTIDAEVELPELSVLPIKRLSLEPFTHEEFTRVKEYFLGNKPLYANPKTSTKESLTGVMKQLEYTRGTLSDQTEIDAIDEQIASFRNQIEGTPSLTFTDPVDPVPKLLPPSPGGGDTQCEYLSALADLGNGRHASIWITNFLNTDDLSAISFSDSIYMVSLDPFENALPETRQAKDQSMTVSQAKQKAMQVVSALAIPDMAVGSVSAVTFYDSVSGLPVELYSVSAFRQIDGMPGGEGGRGGYSPGITEANQFSCRGDVVEMLLSDEGVIQFKWSSKAAIAETVTEDCELLPFDQISKAFLAELTDRYQDGGTTETKLDISRVTLEYVSQDDTGHPGDGLLVPAWVFWQNSSDGLPVRPLIRVNAVSGEALFG